MANKVAKVEILEKLIKDRHLETASGKVEIGHFWSVLRIYYCIRLGISPQTLCALASRITGRVDHNYHPTTNKINPASLRKWLQLKSIPKNVGHTVVTKEVSKGAADMDAIKDILIKYNSYGDEIAKEIEDAISKSKGELISMKAKTLGAGDFNTVLNLANVIIDLHRNGELTDIDKMPSKAQKEYIIKTIKNKADNGAIHINLTVSELYS